MWLWFIQSKVGRTVAAVSGAALAVALLLWRVFAAGKAAEKAAQTQDSLNNLRERAEHDEAVNALSDTDRRHHLRDWVRGE